MKKYILILSALTVLVSCGKMLDVTPPNAITEEQVQNLMVNGTEAQQQMVLNAIASPMVKYFNYWNIPCGSTGALAPMTYCYQGIEWARTLQGNDVAFGYNTQTNQLAGSPYYDGTAQFKNGDFVGNYAHWAGYAYSISQANLLLGYMTKEAAANSNLAKDGRIRGLCVRAYSYMCLMEEYCQPYLSGGKEKLGMSLYTEYSPGQDPVARSSAEETWNFIKTDLQEAVTLADQEGIGFTTDYNKLEDFDAGIANFLLARACILTGDWAKAITACDAIINSGAYSFIKQQYYGGHNSGTDMAPENLQFLPEDNAFTALKRNPECILGYIKTSSYNPSTQANLCAHFTRLANPFGTYSASASCARIDDRLYNKIADNDFRKDAFYTEQITNYNFLGNGLGVVPSYCALKFAATYGIKDGGEDHSSLSEVGENEFCKFRLSEVYLMKAEAQAQSGNESGAKSTLNALLAARTKEGAPTLTCDNYPSMAGISALDMVKLQYRIEMWGENGREYFNNKRWNINVNRAGSTTHVATNVTLSWQDMTIDIPTNEIENNPLCVKD